MKRGFSLLELILVLGVGSMVSFMKFQDMKNEQESVLATAVGQQMKQMGEAVNRYISIRYDKLSTLSNAAGTGTDPGPRTCNSSYCEITYQTLINEGLLPSTFNGINSQKSQYKIILKRSGISPNYVINGLVATTISWKDDNKIRYDLLGKAMQVAGIDSGMTNTATTASGYNAGWTEKSSDYPLINTAGLLAYRVGYDSSMYSVYLRRDGTLPMTGNLDMGNQDIKNAKNVTASGNATFGGTGNFTGDVISGGNITAAAQVIAHNGYGDKITLGGDAGGDGNDYEIRLYNGTKPLSIYSPNAADYTTVLNVYKNAKIQQRLATNGLDPNEMPPGFSAGGVRTVDVVATGSFYSILSGTNIKDGKYAFYARQDGNVKASGNMTVNGTGSFGGNVTSGGTIKSKNVETSKILLTGNASVGSVCDKNGEILTSKSGDVLICKKLKWRNIVVQNIPPQEIHCRSQLDGTIYTDHYAKIDENGNISTRTIRIGYGDSGWKNGSSSVSYGITNVVMTGISGRTLTYRGEQGEYVCMQSWVKD